MRGFEVTPSRWSPRRATSSSPRTCRRRSRTTPASASASSRPTSSPASPSPSPTATAAPLGFEQSRVLWDHLKAAGHIDAKGKVQDSLKKALKDGTLTVPEHFAGQLDQISQVLKKLAGELDIKNADERRQVRPRQAVLHSAEFKALWDRIKHKTTYRVQFDNEKLIEDCIEALRTPHRSPRPACNGARPTSPSARPGWKPRSATARPPSCSTKATSSCPTCSPISRTAPSSLAAASAASSPAAAASTTSSATRRQFIDTRRRGHQPLQAPCRRGRHQVPATGRRPLLRPGALRAGRADRLPQEPARRSEVRLRTGRLRLRHRAHLRRAIGEERRAIKVYAKLPGWFKVPTPLGSYNPDWAVLVEKKESASTSWWRPRAASSPTIFAKRSGQRSNAAKPISRQSESANLPRNTWSQLVWMMF